MKGSSRDDNLFLLLHEQRPSFTGRSPKCLAFAVRIGEET